MTELNRMVWVDLECSGLEKDNHARPLEIGVAVTDQFGRHIAGMKELVYSFGWRDSINQADPIVLQMHTENGLIDDLLALEAKYKNDPAAAFESHGAFTIGGKVRRWLEETMELGSGKYPMVGSTVNYDRFFLRKDMPNLNEFFHYRNIDISTIKNLCKMLNPELHKRLKQPDKKAHRPLKDIEWSIKEYQFYMDEFLIWG